MTKKDFTVDELKENYACFYRKSTLVLYAAKQLPPFNDDTMIDIFTCGDKFKNPLKTWFAAKELEVNG